MVLQDAKHCGKNLHPQIFGDASNVYQNGSFVILRHARPKLCK